MWGTPVGAGRQARDSGGVRLYGCLDIVGDTSGVFVVSVAAVFRRPR